MTGFRRGGTRRAALNEALHELRRPLQALALAVGPGRSGLGHVETSLLLVTAAVDRLDEEINGRGVRSASRPLPVRPLLEAAVGRWRSRARLANGELSFVGAPPVSIVGDPVGLSQALDNLIVNAIEHGGPAVDVGARRVGHRVRIAVADSGRAEPPASRRASPAEVLARITGRRRRGHGLGVVRRVAAEHRGRFQLRRADLGSVATLELPVADAAR
ncbi:MAG TPA: ATP-binding protein [Solirubrobacterales bacterium]